jgi:hypothetical protein
MPTPPLSYGLALAAVERVEAKLREGYVPQHMGGGKSAVEAAAVEALKDGWTQGRQTFHTRLRIAKDLHNLEPDWSLYRPRQYQHLSPGAPAIVSQDHLAEPDPDGAPVRVVVIGDAHDSPHLPDKSRFHWLGAFINEHQPDWVVSVGDWWCMDCFSGHHDPASFLGRTKPSFDQELESFHESQRAFHAGMDGFKAKRLCTLGNHEERAWRYDNAHPDGSSHAQKVEEAFMQWGWRTSLYGEYRFIGGVGFVHVPLNGRGKPLTAAQQPNKAMCDTIHGDDHRATQMTDHKTGPFRSPTIYSAASALPPGYIEGYANKGGSTWRSGVCTATIWGGHVRQWSFEEMILLKRRYGVREAA